MIDDSFGPWSSTPTLNQWEESKIISMEKWYDIISSSLNINPGNASSIISPTAVKLELSRSTAKSKATAMANAKQQSKLPKPKSQIKKTQKQVSTSSSTLTANDTVSQDTNIINNSNSNNQNETSTSYFSVQYNPRDEFDAPKSWDMFLSSPNYSLQPWPSKYVPMDEVINQAVNPPKNTSSSDKNSRTSKKKYVRK